MAAELSVLRRAGGTENDGIASAVAEARDRRARRYTGVFAVVILLPCLYGFAGKFAEFIHIFRGDPSGVFAITPIVNYLCASLGFFCLLLWAAARGMFHDMERPKHQFLENERALDRSPATVNGEAP